MVGEAKFPKGINRSTGDHAVHTPVHTSLHGAHSKEQRQQRPTGLRTNFQMNHAHIWFPPVLHSPFLPAACLECLCRLSKVTSK